MIVYVVAFALTIIFIRYATFYYNRISCAGIGRTETGGLSQAHYSRRQLKSYKRKYCLYFVLAFFPLFFIAAVRYNVGTDYSFTYVPNFIKILHGESPYSEWGFNLLNKFIQLFTTNPQWLFVVTSFIFTFVLLQTIIRYSSSVSLSVLVVLVSCVFFVFLNNMRQLIAVVLFLRAYPYLVKRDFRCIIFVLLACLFHLSAIVMIIPCFMVNVKSIRKHFLAFAILITVLLPVFSKILEIILIHTKYRYYFSSDFNNGDSTKINILYHFVFFALSYYVLRNRIKKDKQAYVLLFMQFLAFWISSVSLFISISEMISRITMYFQIFQVLLVPYCVKVQKDKTSKVVYSASYFIAYAAYLIYFIIINGYHQVLPYHWIF